MVKALITFSDGEQKKTSDKPLKKSVVHVELERRLEKLDKKEEKEDELHSLRKTEMLLKIQTAQVFLDKANIELEQCKQMHNFENQKAIEELEFLRTKWKLELQHLEEKPSEYIKI